MRQSVCLNMIVKDETPVLRRCLESVRPLIDSWVIVDTGSTDGTQNLVRELLAGIPGELHERPWVDFAHNRTEALQLAHGRGDYLLFIDADEALELVPGFVMPALTADVYSLEVRYGGCSYLRKQLVRNDGRWRWEGVVHEYVTADHAFTEGLLGGAINVPRHDGARARDPLTYRRDALALEKALLADPANARYVFYLAQSYRDANDPELAIRHYRRRVELGGWPEEVWYSLYQIALIEQRMKKPWAEVLEAFLAAYQSAPDRAEPLFRIAMHHQGKGEYHLSHLFLSRAAAIPAPATNRLFVERPIYEYQLAVELAVAAYYVGDHRTAIDTNNRLLRSPTLPAHAVDQIIRNRRFSLDLFAKTHACPAKDPGRASVIVVFRDPGPELDDCVESLLRQDETAWDAVFIDDGSSSDQSSRLPLDDVRVSYVRHQTVRGTETCLTEQLRGSDPDTVVIPLTSRDRFADRAALGHLRTAFTDPACRAAYGQFRTASGSFGNAEPASCEEEHRTRGAALADASPIAFRAGLWRGSLAATWHEAGFAGTRYLDHALTIRIAAPPLPIARTITTETTPLISCLMVTLDRLALAKRAIRSFADQTWPHRELVIVTDGTPRYRHSLERFVAESSIDGVRILDPGPGLPLGALRNVSLAEAKGELVCQWDDDDCSHPDRLRHQYTDMVRQNSRASFLADHLQILSEERVLSWIDWTIGGTTGTAALFPGSLLMFNDPRFRYPEDGPYARQGEDSVFLERLHASVPVASLAGAGYLYLYEYHGRNTFSRDHHVHMSNFRKTASELHGDADRLREAVAYYAVPRPVVILAREGPVFALG